MTSGRPRSIIPGENAKEAALMRLKKILLFTLGMAGVLAVLFAVRKFRR